MERGRPIATEPPPPARTDRLVSLDAFRGATIALMILVNNAGDWTKTYSPLLHAEWHGWTPTDLVFPFFLFAVGVAIPFAFAARLARSGGDRGPLHRQIVRRTILLFALGLFLNWFPFYTVDWSRARIPGILGSPLSTASPRSPGSSDELAYDLGLIDTDLPFTAAKRRFRIDDEALRAVGREDFSRRIRQGL